MPKFYILWPLWHGFILKWPWESSLGNSMETLVHTWYLRLVDRWNRKYCQRKYTIQMPKFYILWPLWHDFTLKWPWSHQITTHLETLYHTRSLIIIDGWIKISTEWQPLQKMPSFYHHPDMFPPPNLWQTWDDVSIHMSWPLVTGRPVAGMWWCIATTPPPYYPY